MRSVKRTNSKRPPVKPYAVINYILVDRSGSMATFNNNHVIMNFKLLNDTQENAIKNDIPTYVSFISFDNEEETHLSNVDIRKIKIPSKSILEGYLSPRGTTKFFDTVIKALSDIEKIKTQILKSFPKEIQRLNPNIVTILNCTTDGLDNASSYTEKDLKEKMIEYRKKKGESLFLTANIDAVELGKKYGFHEDTCLTMNNSDEKAIQFAFDCVQQTSRAMSDGSAPPAFTPLQRQISISNQSAEDSEEEKVDWQNIKIPFQPTCRPPRLLRRKSNQ